ncbi:unnamed protein product [Boreogadus saida]
MALWNNHEEQPMESNPDSEVRQHPAGTFSEGLEGGVEGPSPPLPAEHGGSGRTEAKETTLYCTRSKGEHVG